MQNAEVPYLFDAAEEIIFGATDAPDDAITTVEWDLGDGNFVSSPGRVMIVKFPQSGDHLIRARLTEYLNLASHKDSFKFSVSLGTARFDPLKPSSIRELIAQADHAMYDQKRCRCLPRLTNAVCYQS